MRRLIADPGYIDKVLRRGAERARAIAEPVLREAQDDQRIAAPLRVDVAPRGAPKVKNDLLSR